MNANRDLSGKMLRTSRFYSDISDQHYFIRDREGHEFKGVEAAKTAAIDALPDMARDELPDGDSRSFVALVRDEQGRTLVQASMSFGVTWLTERGALTDTRSSE